MVYLQQQKKSIKTEKTFLRFCKWVELYFLYFVITICLKGFPNLEKMQLLIFFSTFIIPYEKSISKIAHDKNINKYNLFIYIIPVCYTKKKRLYSCVVDSTHDTEYERHEFDSQPWHSKVNSVFHPTEVNKWVPTWWVSGLNWPGKGIVCPPLPVGSSKWKRSLPAKADILTSHQAICLF